MNSAVIAGLKEIFVHPDFNELALFLGSEFNLNWCNASDLKGHHDAKNYASNDAFMRNTLAFCYQNIGLMAEGIHRPYIAKLLEICADVSHPSVIDVGAGGGQLGLALHTLGFDVAFADIAGRSWNWLHWRLLNRRLNLPLYVWDSPDCEIPKHNFAICFDVLEHLSEEDQHKLLIRLEAVGSNVMTNLIIDHREEMGGVHFDVNPMALVEWIKQRWTCWYQPYYPDENGEPRQWLLIYGEGVKLTP